jgi:hypothetical protein
MADKFKLPFRIVEHAGGWWLLFDDNEDTPIERTANRLASDEEVKLWREYKRLTAELSLAHDDLVRVKAELARRPAEGAPPKAVRAAK